MDFATATETEIREFLRLCLNPRPTRTRTPEALAEIIPAPLRANLHRHAPNLADLRAEADRAAQEAKRTAAAYADALAAWIAQDPPGPPCPVFHDPEKDAWSWACLEELGGCGHQSVSLFLLEDTADSDYRYHLSRCFTVTAPGPCPQNRRGDKATPQPHAFAAIDGGPARCCLFCALPADDIAPGYRTPDGRVWTLTALATEDGTPLYESPFVGARYTAAALAHLHGQAEPLHEPAPAYVFNADSVNRTTKHLQDGPHTRCRSRYRASKPIPAEQAAALALCRGCREAATEAAGLPTA